MLFKRDSSQELMRIFHHVHISGADTPTVEVLRRIGIDLEGDHIPTGPLHCKIPEDDPRWRDIAMLLEAHKSRGSWIGHRMSTEFTPQERNEAEYLFVGTCWTQGYPEPSDITPVPGARFLPYFPASYDLSTYCPVCLCGAKQKAPFRMKKEPAWGRRSILRLNWIQDELFVRTEVWDSIFRPLGIEKRPVLLHKSGAEMDTVVQLVVPDEVAIDVSGLPSEACFACNRRKYASVGPGLRPPPVGVIRSIAKSKEYFGPAIGFKEVLVASSMYRKIKGAGVKGVDFEPCARPQTPSVSSD